MTRSGMVQFWSWHPWVFIVWVNQGFVHDCTICATNEKCWSDINFNHAMRANGIWQISSWFGFWFVWIYQFSGINRSMKWKWSFSENKFRNAIRCGTKKMRQTLDENISNIICHKAKPQNTFWWCNIWKYSCQIFFKISQYFLSYDSFSKAGPEVRLEKFTYFCYIEQKFSNWQFFQI